MKFLYTISLISLYAAGFSQIRLGATKLACRISPDSIWIAEGSKMPLSSENLNLKNTMVNIVDSCKIIHNNKFFMASVGGYNHLFNDDAHQFLYNIQAIENIVLKSKNLEKIIATFYNNVKPHLTHTTGAHSILVIDSFIRTKKNIMETYIGTFVANKPIVVKMNFKVVGTFVDWHIDTTNEYITQASVSTSGYGNSKDKSEKISDTTTPTELPTFLKLEALVRSELQTNSSSNNPVNIFVLYKDGYKWQLRNQKCN